MTPATLPSRLTIDGLPLIFHSLTPARWSDLEELFGARGACGGCWCMWWRIPRAQFNQQKGRKNKSALKKITGVGETPGILAYCGGRAVAWCALGPRDVYPVLDRSRILKRLDHQPVWSIVCLYVDKKFRRKGITVALLKSAVGFVKQRGGKILEGYPVDPQPKGIPDVFAWTGLASAFRQAGFTESARRSPTRPIMRYQIKN